MNILQCIEEGVIDVELLLENDMEKAKKYRLSYKQDVEIMLKCTERFMLDRMNEIEKLDGKVAKIENKRKKGWFQKISLKTISKHQDKLASDLVKANKLLTRIEKLKFLFDGYLNLI